MYASCYAKFSLLMRKKKKYAAWFCQYLQTHMRNRGENYTLKVVLWITYDLGEILAKRVSRLALGCRDTVSASAGTSVAFLLQEAALLQINSLAAI